MGLVGFRNHLNLSEGRVDVFSHAPLNRNPARPHILDPKP